MQPQALWVDSSGTLHEAKRIREVQSPEESMTMGEERFYHSVWNSTADLKLEGPHSRTFTLGYDRLAKLVRLDEKSVRQLIPKLVFKRIIELVAAENSSERVGRTYRIFSPEQILIRQREAGLQHIVKKGRAVEFVWQSGHTPAPVLSLPPTVGVRSLPTETWSAAVDGALRQLQLLPDAATVRALIAGCRAKSPDATIDEIVLFVQERGKALQVRPVSKPLAYLMMAVPACFEQERLRKHREQDQVLAASSASQLARHAEEEILDMKSEWEAWVRDSSLPEEDRQFAAAMLKRIRG
jgi:hypothetical protein